MDPDHAAANAIYLALRNGVRADMVWEDIDDGSREQLIGAWRAGRQAYVEAGGQTIVSEPQQYANTPLGPLGITFHPEEP